MPETESVFHFEVFEGSHGGGSSAIDVYLWPFGVFL